MNGIRAWMQRNWTQVLAQLAHFFAGYSFAATAAALGHSPWWGIAALQAWAVPKEFWFDYRYEDAGQRGSSPLDYAVYQAGAAALLLVVRFL